MEEAAKDLRITTNGKVRSYVASALEALPHGPVKIEAQGPAVNKAVTVAEITKRRLRGLHQNTQIGLASGASTPKHLPAISILLSLQPLDASQPGYQPPLTDEELLEECLGDEGEAEDRGEGADFALAEAAASPSRADAVVFLDIDGVLLPFGAGAPIAPSDPAHHFPSRCLGALSRLLAVSGARLVLSSTWRAVPAAREQILANFRRHATDEPAHGAALGAIGDLDEMTDPATHSERQWEIHDWLLAHPAVRRWVALDDEDLLEGTPNAQRRAAFVGHVVRTQSHVGLTEELAESAIAMLAAQT